jgi:hypothetical protein
VFFLVMVAGSVFLALVQTPWWWVAVPFWLVFLAMHLALPHRLGRRLELLRD